VDKGDWKWLVGGNDLNGEQSTGVGNAGQLVLGLNRGQLRLSVGSWFSDVLTTASTSYSSGASHSYCPTAITDANWHHVVVTRSGSSYAAYLDGALQCTGTSTATFGFKPRGWQIGSGPEVSDGADVWSGSSVDEFMLFSRALTATEALRLSTATAAPSASAAYFQSGVCACPANTYWSGTTCAATCAACLYSDARRTCPNGVTSCACISPFVTNSTGLCDCSSTSYGATCSSSCSTCTGANTVCTSGVAGGCACASGFVSNSFFASALGVWYLEGGVSNSVAASTLTLAASGSTSWNTASTGIALSGGYLSLTNAPSLSGDFTLALFFSGAESASTHWRWLASVGASSYAATSLVVATNGNVLRVSLGTWCVRHPAPPVLCASLSTLRSG
jgi:hypothetical protein